MVNQVCIGNYIAYKMTGEGSDLSSNSIRAKQWPWVMLLARLGLFVGFQGLFAAIFWLAGSGETLKQAWEQGANWWMLVVTLTNLVCMFLLVRLFAANGENYWNIFRIERQNVGKDLLVMLGILVVTGPVAFLPNIFLGGWLFGDAQRTLDMILRPLPYWGVYLGAISFSVTQGLAELPTYFSYVMPQFKSQSMATWLAIGLPVLMLGLQHIGIPLLFDAAFYYLAGDDVPAFCD